MKCHIMMFTTNGNSENITITKLSISPMAQTVINTTNNTRTTNEIVFINIFFLLKIAMHNVRHREKRIKVATTGIHSINSLSDKLYKSCSA